MFDKYEHWSYTIWYFEYDESILNQRMNENMEFPGATEADINWLQDCFVQSLKDKVPHFNTTNNPSLNHEHCPLLDNSLKVTIGGGGPSGSLHPWWGEGNHSVIDCLSPIIKYQHHHSQEYCKCNGYHKCDFQVLQGHLCWTPWGPQEHWVLGPLSISRWLLQLKMDEDNYNSGASGQWWRPCHSFGDVWTAERAWLPAQLCQVTKMMRMLMIMMVSLIFFFKF